MSSERVLLIGPRGAGKTVVGVRLAAALGLPFCDADALVEQETGETIAALLAAGSFRAHEQAALAALLRGAPAVAATGGGAVLWHGLAEAARGWRVVWLDAAPAVLRDRIRADSRARPSLSGRPAHEEIEAIAAARAPLYRALAWQHVDTSDLTPAEVVHLIEKLLRDEGNCRGR